MSVPGILWYSGFTETGHVPIVYQEVNKMKKLLSVALAVSMAFSLTACSSPTSGGNASGTGGGNEASADKDGQNSGRQGKVRLTYLSRYTNPEDNRAKFFMDRLDEFRTQNPDIEIEDISVTDSDAYMSKMKSLIAAGAAPDVFACSAQIPRYDLAKNGAIANVKPLIQSPEWTGPSDPKFFLGYDFSDMGLDGVYGVPNNLSTLQMFINTKLLEERGLPIPETWEDVESIAQPLISDGITPVGLSAKNKPKCMMFFTLLGVKMYGMDFQKKFAEGYVDWNDPQVMDVLDKFKSYIDMGMFGPDAISFAYDNVMSDFEQGKVAILFEAGFQFAKIQDMSNSQDVACVNFFVFKDKPEYGNIWFTDYYEGLCIGSKPGTREYDAAVKLFTFMLSQDTFNRYAETMGGGAYPLEVEFDRSRMGNIMEDFMNEYKECGEITALLTSYNNDPVIADLTASEMQTLFVGRSTEEIARTLTAEYEKAFRK